MTVSVPRSLVLAAAVAALPLLAVPASAEPYDVSGRNDGVTVTINKHSNYLNTRTTPRPLSQATYRTSAVYQPFYQQTNSISFYRGALPRPFDIPGF
ncbi:MAG: hypothetical protein ABW275_01015 [Hansschlegelia sp.]|jgi:hypothetical protein